MKEAMYYTKEKDNRVRCNLCPHHCLLADGKVGICFGRENRGGTLYAINYGKITSLSMDPIEKKPLYHFYPGSYILSTAPNGCNLRCQFCQNWEISQTKLPDYHLEDITPERLVEIAIKRKSIGISYTYSEPFIWFEFLLDVTKLAREKGLKNVYVTNGTINEEPLKELLPYIDALNIDLKSMNPDFYKRICKGYLETTLKTIEITHKYGCFVELTNLVIPTLNDKDDDIDKLIDWVANLDVNIPLHFSRYFPRHKMEIPPTPEETLKNAYEKAKKKLRYVYVGNIYIEGTDNTYCHNCGNILIARSWYNIKVVGLKNNSCNKCGTKANIII